MDHFPRTDPVAIMVVRHEGSILLGRQSSWKPGMYSALAGFVEPGETIEDAARREVFEESGVKVGAVRYVTSQPWPFLSNLMIGLIGEAVSTEIRLDENELEDARWFPAADARMMMDRTHPDGLYAANPYAIAHELVRVALEG
jgi:NAD+ diphosphatase